MAWWWWGVCDIVFAPQQALLLGCAGWHAVAVVSATELRPLASPAVLGRCYQPPACPAGPLQEHVMRLCCLGCECAYLCQCALCVLRSCLAGRRSHRGSLKQGCEALRQPVLFQTTQWVDVGTVPSKTVASDSMEGHAHALAPSGATRHPRHVAAVTPGVHSGVHGALQC